MGWSACKTVESSIMVHLKHTFFLTILINCCITYLFYEYYVFTGFSNKLIVIIFICLNSCWGVTSDFSLK